MSKEEIQRILMDLLAKNGISLDDLPEPVPPTDEEVQRLIEDLQDEGRAQAAAEALRSWPEKTTMGLRTALKDPKYLEAVSKSETLQKPFGKMVDVLCKSAPDLIVDHLARLSQITQISDKCIETAFRHSPKKLELLFEQYVTSEQSGAIRAALIGIRNAAWKDGLTVERDDPLYSSCLRICSPDYPTRPQADSTTTSDSALFVCQAFGSLAQVDLAKLPYFSVDNPHFQEIVSWLPSVVSHASHELVRSEFEKVIELHNRDVHMRHTCMSFLPLAALKLGQECRSGIMQLLSHSPNLGGDFRGRLIKVLAIVDCGRDPLSDALVADRNGEFCSLNKYEQAVLLLHAFDAEVCNGGVFQFLFNSAGLRATETLDALQLTGDIAGQNLLKAGIECVMSEQSDAPSPHAATRQLNSSYLRKKFSDSIKELQSAYYEQNDYNQRIFSFVLEHLDQFRKH